MSKNNSHTQTQQAHDTSALERLSLEFEYNVTWADEKKSIKERSTLTSS